MPGLLGKLIELLKTSKVFLSLSLGQSLNIFSVCNGLQSDLEIKPSFFNSFISFFFNFIFFKIATINQ